MSEEITITIGELVDAENSLSTVLALPLVSQATAFRLGVLRKTLRPYLETFHEARQKMFEDLGIPINGQLVIPPERKELYNAQMKDLRSPEIKFSFKKLTMFDLRTRRVNGEELVWLTANLYSDLDWLLAPPDEEEQQQSE